MTTTTLPAGAVIRLIVVAWLSLAAREAAAQASINFEVRNAVTIGHGKVGFVATATDPVSSLIITLRPTGRGKRVTLRARNIGADSPHELLFDPRPGNTVYQVGIKAVFADGSVYDDQAEMTFTAAPAMKVSIPKQDVDMDAGRLVFHTNNEPFRAVLDIIDLDGEVMHHEEFNYFAGATTTQHISWPLPRRPIKTLRVVVYDKLGSFGGMEFFPFQVEIPHQEVVFDSGQDAVRADQLPRVKATMAHIRTEIQRYGTDLTLRLYVAGFTDTVGDAAGNQALSERRARSIAAAFKQLGLAVPIYYQGFGEKVLAVATADNVDEERNRRALYILSDHTPASSPGLPGSAWKRLR